MERGREQGGSLAAFPLHRPAQLRRAGGDCNLLLPRTREQREESRDSEVSLELALLLPQGPVKCCNLVSSAVVPSNHWPPGPLLRKAVQGSTTLPGCIPSSAQATTFSLNFLISCIPEQHRRGPADWGPLNVLKLIRYGAEDP